MTAPRRRGALGMIECGGLVGALEAADAMVKAADVEVAGYRSLGNGQVSVHVRGDVGAVNAAVDAGRTAAVAVGDLRGCAVIPRPAGDTEGVLGQAINPAR